MARIVVEGVVHFSAGDGEVLGRHKGLTITGGHGPLILAPLTLDFVDQKSMTNLIDVHLTDNSHGTNHRRMNPYIHMISGDHLTWTQITEILDPHLVTLEQDLIMDVALLKTSIQEGPQNLQKDDPPMTLKDPLRISPGL